MIALSFSAVKVFFPENIVKFDNNLKDFMFKVRGPIDTNQTVLIVDIDEKSLRHLGQWPWARNDVAVILENLTNAGVGVIGLDIVFPEIDRTSPDLIAKKYKLESNNLPNYDEILAKTISQTPTIMGYQFELSDKLYSKKEPPSLPAVFIKKNIDSDFENYELGSEYIIKANGIIQNHDLLQNNSFSSGFFNNIPDESGIVRSVPLIIEYNDELFSSLALEVTRIALQEKKVVLNYTHLGIENIQIGDFEIPTDRAGRLIINYRGAEKTFQYISAIDI